MHRLGREGQARGSFGIEEERKSRVWVGNVEGEGKEERGDLGKEKRFWRNWAWGRRNPFSSVFFFFFWVHSQP